MKTLKDFSAFAIVTGLMLTSCTKETTSPPATSLGVRIQATNASFSVLKSAILTTPSFVWDSSFIIVSKIEFEAEKKEGTMSADPSNINFEWNGPKKIDLFHLNSLIGNITLQPGLYDEISIKINAFKADADNLPDFYLSGNYTNSLGSTIPIVFAVNEDFEFRVKQEGFMLDAVNDYTSLISMNLSLLFAGIQSADLDGTTLTEGKILISNTSNSSLYDKIISNLSSCEESRFTKGSGSDSGDGHGSDSGNGHGSDSGNGDGSDPGPTY